MRKKRKKIGIKLYGDKRIERKREREKSREGMGKKIGNKNREIGSWIGKVKERNMNDEKIIGGRIVIEIEIIEKKNVKNKIKEIEEGNIFKKREKIIIVIIDG